ncbi:MAG: hypothetical protein HUU23_13685 [Caldilineales bacterium]|nr:hypothetical protein [Caldilineales bacterium]
MSPLTRWFLAVVMAISLIVLIIGVGFTSLLFFAFGSDSCSSWPSNLEGLLFFGPPALMILGAVTGSVLFGLNKRWFWWLGAIAAGGLAGIAAYVIGMALIIQACA